MNELVASWPCPHGNTFQVAAPEGTFVERIAFRFACGCRGNGAGPLSRVVTQAAPVVPSIFERKRNKRADFTPA